MFFPKNVRNFTKQFWIFLLKTKENMDPLLLERLLKGVTVSRSNPFSHMCDKKKSVNPTPQNGWKSHSSDVTQNSLLVKMGYNPKV